MFNLNNSKIKKINKTTFKFEFILGIRKRAVWSEGKVLRHQNGSKERRGDSECVQVDGETRWRGGHSDQQRGGVHQDEGVR